jgi:uncharacterized protein (DUF2384 family)
MATNPHATHPTADSAAVLGKAVVRAAERLAVNGDTLARVLGISPASASRLAAGTYVLNPSRKEWDLALLFVRLFRSLDSIVGSDEAARTWMRSENLALRNAPANLITQIQGLVHVVDYLDSHRGRI